MQLANNYKLTIAIPTYNRVHLLKKTLPVTISLCKDRPVELLISDNCSSDETESYMNEILQEYPWIHYYRQSKNIGADANFLFLFDNAQGEYVLLLGDDDELQEKGFLSVLKAIEKKPEFIYMNALEGKEKKYEESLIFYDSKEKFLEEIGIFITYISVLVFKTEYLREINDKEQYIGTYFLHSHLAVRTMLRGGTYIYVTDCGIKAPLNKTLSCDVYQVYIKLLGDIFFKTAIESGFDEETIDRIAHRIYSKTLLGYVVFYRGTCKQSKTWDKDAIWVYVNRYPDLIFKYKMAVNCPRIFLMILRSDAICNIARAIVKKIPFVY